MAELAGLLRPSTIATYGSLATVGRKYPVVQIGRLRLAGFAAWLIWCVAHIYYLIGFRNRPSVMLKWAWNYVTPLARSWRATHSPRTADGSMPSVIKKADA